MLLPEAGTAQSQIGPPVPDMSCSVPPGPNNFVTVAITKLVEFIGTQIDGDDFSPRNGGDFYAKVTIDGVPRSSFDERIEGERFDYCPGCFPVFCGCILPIDSEIHAEYGPDRLWRFSQDLPLGVGVPARSAVNIRIEIWDDDPGSNPDDMADLKPGPGNQALNLVFDPNTGQVSGDVNSPQGCSMGGFFRSNPVEVCFEISSLPDSDGDGLFDVWEACGFDADGDGTIDVDFPAFRADPRYKDLADPMHKDLFVELDWMTGQEPTQDAIKALKNAFVFAPNYAGLKASDLPNGVSAKINPDGKHGINLWVDTGSLKVNTSEDGAGPGTCSDGIDNGKDFFTDAADPECRDGSEDGAGPGTCNDGKDNGEMDGIDANDPDCLVGDNLGGGNPIDTASAPAPDICAPDDEAEFNSVKKDHFVTPNPGRSFIFRYGISARLCTNEDGAGPNTCTDGKDNGMDGTTDSLGSANDNEDGAGAGSCGDGMDNGANDGADDLDKDCQGDPECNNISWGELGGNDFLLRGAANLPGIIMHEVGHNLNLNHGGNVPNNCKPNYVSVMNYDNALGIRQVRGVGPFSTGSTNSIVDYSPPRFGIEDEAGFNSCEDGKDNGPMNMDGLADADDPDCLKRGIAPLPELKENMLDESTILDSTDPVNQFVFKNALGKPISWPLNGDRDGDGKPDGVDWNGNGRPPLYELVIPLKGGGVFRVPGTCDDNMDNDTDGQKDGNDEDCMHDKNLPSINIDTSSDKGVPRECKNNSKDSTLAGFNDWLHISLPFRQFAQSGDGIVNPPPPDEEPTLEELIEAEEELNTTDLSITKISDPDRVEAGADFTYILTVTNKGPNPAGRVEVVDALPPEVSYKSDNAGCVEETSGEETPTGILICDLGTLLPGELREIEITVGTAYMSDAEVPISITNTATVENFAEFAGPDPEPNDNFTTVTTTITLEVCGDGAVGPGEGCDDGNTFDGDCCSSTCRFEPGGSACGDAGDDCTNQDTCDGAGTCTDNGFKPNGTFCSDGDNCTRTDTCQSGVCTGSKPLICGRLPASICGTSGNDNIIGTPLADVIHGWRGNDTIYGRGGNDIVCGGKGDDTIKGGSGNDRLFGNRGNDTLRGGNGDDILNGNFGRDNLFGGPGDDVLNGGSNIDYCNGGLHTTGDTANPSCETVVNVP